jgi:uncharacterized membrane protein YoaK (UPF0700 family)
MHCPCAVSKASFKKTNKEILHVVHGRQLFMTASISAVTNQSGKNRLAAVCSFLTGWADVALFLRHKTFATMMTGNTLWLAQALVEQRYRLVGYYSSVIASYLMGLVVFRKTDLSLKQRTMPVSAALVASLFVASEVLHFAGVPSIPVCLLALGFGIVNSVGAEVTGSLTFVVTGHMTKLTHQLVDRLLSRKQKAMDPKAVIQSLTVILGFLGGALWAFLIHKVLLRQFHMEFSVLGISYGLLFLWQDMESLGGAWWLRKDKRMCELDDDGVMCQTAEELEEVDASEANTSTIEATVV